ncbi:MAG: Bug family tripartite tricarboxylate transporter substrate binding protein [Pseudomonadota bacterium]
MKRWLIALALIAFGSVFAAPVQAQIGEQPIRIIFPFGAGGSGDALSRLIAEKLRAGLNRPVIVENRSGAAGRIGVQAVKSAAPDGMTLLLTPIAPVAVYQHVYKSLGYDPLTDLDAVAQIGTFDFGIAVGPKVPVKSLKELVAWAKANPNEANYATPGAGTLPHFLAVLFGQRAGLDLRHVSYRGSAPALTDLVGGQLPMIVTTLSDMTEMHKGGRIKVLAVSGAKRSQFMPEVPTLAEEGYDLTATGWYGLFVPAKTPPDFVEKVNRIVVDAIKSPDVSERMLTMGLQPTGTSAAEMAAIQKRDSAFWAPAVQASGFKAEE